MKFMGIQFSGCLTGFITVLTCRIVDLRLYWRAEGSMCLMTYSSNWRSLAESSLVWNLFHRAEAKDCAFSLQKIPLDHVWIKNETNILKITLRHLCLYISGDISWVMRIQNDISHTHTTYEFPLNELSTLYMPSYEEPQRPLLVRQDTFDENQSNCEDDVEIGQGTV